jgi:Capsular polysaccharide synthesis protein
MPPSPTDKELVQKCLRSWEDQNPGWDVRCLDDSSALHYAPVLVYFDLTKRDVTVASLSDVLRISVLDEFESVWVDATLFCNRPR